MTKNTGLVGKITENRKKKMSVSGDVFKIFHPKTQRYLDL